VILVKFAPDALETPPQQLRPNELGRQGRQAARLRQLLNARRGPGQKLFRNFAPADTLGRHRGTGERVRLKDLSRWYRFPVRDTTNVDSLAARLEALPPVLKATPDYRATPDRRASRSPEEHPEEPQSGAASRTVPNDPKFDDQWGYDNSATDADVDAPEAWSLQTGRSDVTVAVVDGGVDLDLRTSIPVTGAASSRASTSETTTTTQTTTVPVANGPTTARRWPAPSGPVRTTVKAWRD
jgi:hypothetical protein